MIPDPIHLTRHAVWLRMTGSGKNRLRRSDQDRPAMRPRRGASDSCRSDAASVGGRGRSPPSGAVAESVELGDEGGCALSTCGTLRCWVLQPRDLDVPGRVRREHPRHAALLGREQRGPGGRGHVARAARPVRGDRAVGGHERRGARGQQGWRAVARGAAVRAGSTHRAEAGRRHRSAPSWRVRWPSGACADSARFVIDRSVRRSAHLEGRATPSVGQGQRSRQRDRRAAHTPPANVATCEVADERSAATTPRLARRAA